MTILIALKGLLTFSIWFAVHTPISLNEWVFPNAFDKSRHTEHHLSLAVIQKLLMVHGCVCCRYGACIVGMCR